MISKIVLSAIVSLLFCFEGHASAQAVKFAKPGTNPKTAKGYRVRIYPNWAFDGSGFYRVKVELALNPPLTVAKRSHLFNVVVSQRSYNQRLLTYSTPIEIEAGKSKGTAFLEFPVSDELYSWGSQLHIESDGNLKLNDYDLFKVQNTIKFGQQNDSGPTLLIVTDAVLNVYAEEHLITRNATSHLVTPVAEVEPKSFPSLNGLGHLYVPYQSQYVAPSGKKTVSTTDVLDSASVHAIPPADLPESWTGLSSVEMIVIPFDNLRSVATQQGKQYEALQSWVAAGGTLVVSLAGTDYEEADLVRQTIPQQFANTADRRMPWFIPEPDFFNEQRFITESASAGNTYFHQHQIDAFESRKVFRKDTKLPANPMKKLPPGTDIAKAANGAEAPFVFYRYLNGRVVLVNDDMTNWTAKEWHPLINLHNYKNRTISDRVSGMAEYAQPNLSFGIPGVNLPPARIFLCLIGLFVFFAGPLTYSWLKKRDRLQWMFVTTPVTSILACLGLFTYAILSDGFHNRGRMRTFTTIDHGTNQAVTYARHSHYSGSQPGPYKIGADELVFNTRTGNASPTTMRVESDGTLLTGGDIRTRMPHQLVTSKTSKTNERLLLVPNSAEGSTPQVQNRFVDDIELAVFRTDSGLYMVKNLKAGATGKASLVEMEAIRQAINEIKVKHSPDLEEVLNPTTKTTPIDDDSTGDCDYLFESLSVGSKLNRYLATGRYLAFFSSRKNIAQPEEGIEYSHQLHIIHGIW